MRAPNYSRILITGGTGFLGKSLTTALQNKGYSDIIPVNSSICDLLDVKAVESLLLNINPTCIIHLAARVGGIGANRVSGGQFCYENLLMGINVLESARKIIPGAKMVIAGTICAYPKFTAVPFKETDLFNGYPEETNAPYGLAKKMLLTMAQAYRQQYGSNFVYLLPVNLYGPNDNFNLETSHVIPAMIRKFHTAKMNDEKIVTLWGDGTATREFLYVDDCAEAFVATMETYNKPEPLNIGSGNEISIKDLANLISTIVGFQGKIQWDETKPNGQPRRCLCIDEALKNLDWKPTTELKEGLVKTVKWWEENNQEFSLP